MHNTITVNDLNQFRYTYLGEQKNAKSQKIESENIEIVYYQYIYTSKMKKVFKARKDCLIHHFIKSFSFG